MSETGLEQAVAAPRVSAKSSIKCQFSGPLSPRPPETTTSASAMVTLSVALSTDDTVTPDAANAGAKASTLQAVSFSTKPKALFDTPIIFTSEEISVCVKALLVKAVRFTVKGDKFEGAATTLVA